MHLSPPVLGIANPNHPYPTAHELRAEGRQADLENDALTLNEAARDIIDAAREAITKLLADTDDGTPCMAEGHDWQSVLAMLVDVTPIPLVTEDVEEWAFLRARVL